MQGFLPGVEVHARPLPWTTGESGRLVTHGPFLYLQHRERPDSPVVQGKGDSTTLHTREKVSHYGVELQTEEQEVRISQKK